MGSHLTGAKMKQGLFKVRFWGLCYFLYTYTYTYIYIYIYVNDITDEIQSQCLLYTDDTSLFEVVDSPDNTAVMLNKDIESIQRWDTKWLVTINPNKSECMTFSSKRIRPLHSDLFYNARQGAHQPLYFLNIVKELPSPRVQRGTP